MIDRNRLATLLARERATFAERATTRRSVTR
jgi:hypothetical protein